MATDDFQIGSAVIPIRVEDGQVEPGLRKVEAAVKRAGSRAESEGDGGGLMSKYLFGRRGREGVGESAEHAIGHAALGRGFRQFTAGGALGLGIGMVSHELIDLGREWLHSASGAEAHAKAVEKAAEAYKGFQAAVEETAKAKEKADRPLEVTGAMALGRILHPTTREKAAEEQIKDLDAKIKERADERDKLKKDFEETKLSQAEANAITQAGGGAKELLDAKRAKQDRMLAERSPVMGPPIMGQAAGWGPQMIGWQPNENLTSEQLEARKRRLLGLHQGLHVGGQRPDFCRTLLRRAPRQSVVRRLEIGGARSATRLILSTFTGCPWRLRIWSADRRHRVRLIRLSR